MISNIKTFTDILIKENDEFISLKKSLEFLATILRLEAVALILSDITNNRNYIVSCNQYHLHNEFIIKLPSDFSNYINNPTSSKNTIEKYSTVLETEIEKSNFLSIFKDEINNEFSVYLVTFSENTDFIESIDLFLTIFVTYFAPNRFLNKLKEKTNKISRQKLDNGLTNYTIESKKELFESFSEGIIILDKELNILYINKSAEKISGYSGNWLYGKKINEFIPDYYQSFFNKKQQVQSFDIDFITASNEIKTISVSALDMFDDENIRLFMFKDITDKYLFQEHYQATVDLLIKMVDNSILGIIATNINGTIILFNPSASEILGYTSESVLNKLNISNLFESEDIWKSIFENIKSNNMEGLYPFQTNILSSSKEKIPVNISLFTVPGYKGKDSRIVIFLSDLRQQIEMEKKLISIQKELEDSKKEAMLTQFAGTMAHELNQPLMAILGYSELINNKELSKEKLQKAISRIVSESNRMSEIVKKISTITSFETKKYVGTANIFDITK